MSKRVTTSDELFASEARFRAQFKGTPVPIFSWQHRDNDFVLIDFNDAAATITENRIVHLMGRRASELYRQVPEVIEHMERCFKQRRTIRREADFRLLTTGELKHLDVSFVYAPPDLVLIHTEDITKRRRAEAALRVAERKYREIFDNSSEGIFQTTPEGRILTANIALARMLGFSSAEELIRERTDLSRQHYVDPSLRDHFKSEMTRRGAVRGFEYEALRKDGSKIWISTNVRMVRDANGATLYYEGTATDISDRKRAELRSRTLATLAQRLSGAKTQHEAAQIMTDAADSLLGWDAARFDLYDAERDLMCPVLSIETIAGKRVDVTSCALPHAPSRLEQSVISGGPKLTRKNLSLSEDCAWEEQDDRPAEAMTVPIHHGKTVIGILSLRSYRAECYDERALGDIESLVGLCGEALNRIRVAESLRASEERFRQIAENVEDVIRMVDSEISQLLYVNPAYEKIWGRTCDSLYKRLRSLVEAVHPEDRSKVASMFNQQVLGKYATCEFRIVKPDGTIRWIQDRSFPILNDEGRVYRIASIAEDITERKKVEEDLRRQKETLEKIFDHIPAMISFVDADQRVRLVNHEFERILGWTLEEILDDRFDIFVACFPNQKERDEALQFLTESNGEWVDFKPRCKDGRIISTTWALMRLSDGTSIGIGQDITQRKLAEESLQTFSRQLIDAQENERKRIARELHDEIGQIMTAVRLNLEGLIDQANARAGTAQIYDSIGLVDHALRQVRDLSFELRPSFLDDLGLLVALRWYADRFSQRSGVVTRLQLQPLKASTRLPRDIETAVFRIFQEALTNVARHARATEVLIEFSNDAKDLCMRIKDNGVGFHPPHFSGKPAPLATLGLRGMKERAVALNGKLEICSGTSGTEICLQLPLLKTSG